MDIKALHEIFKSYSNIIIESRESKKKSIFFALKGYKQNGNRFATEALEKGCEYAVVSDKNFRKNRKCIVVSNPLKTLQRLALWHRLNTNVTVLAITGTNGKTTTKELAARVLESKYCTLSTEGNYNNQIGLPLTLLRLRDRDEIAIIEMGASQRHDISFLCSLAQPDVGLITNYGKAHLEKFKSVANIIATKSELYHFLDQSGGIGLIRNQDQKQIKQSEFMDQTYTYGNKDAAFEVYSHLSKHGNACIKFSDIEVESQLLGTHNAQNIAAAAAIGAYFKVSPQNIKKALESYMPSNQRTEIREINDSLWIIDTYNANPSSMTSAIEMMQQRKELFRKKILILGDMLELGDTAIKEHQHIIDTIAKENSFEKVILVGELFGQTNQRGFLHFKDTRQATLALEHIDLIKKTILIKGSRGMNMESMVPK